MKNSALKFGCYHSGLDQHERERVISAFRNAEFDVLLSTDLGGRGLDIEDIKSVVNFDAPKDFEQYIHRTGRTARAGKSGVCLSFLSKSDYLIFSDLVGVLEKAKQSVPEFLKSYQEVNRMKKMNTILLD